MTAVDGHPVVAWTILVRFGMHRKVSELVLSSGDARCMESVDAWRRHTRHGAEVGFGVGADVGEAGGIGPASGFAGVGVGPALSLLVFDGVIVEPVIHRGGWGEYRGWRLGRGPRPL